MNLAPAPFLAPAFAGGWTRRPAAGGVTCPTRPVSNFSPDDLSSLNDAGARAVLLDYPPVPAFRWTARRAVAALFFLNGAITAAWISRIPAIQAQHAFTPGELGLALLALAAGAVTAMPLCGGWITRWGGRFCTRTAALGLCAALPLLALPVGRWTFVALLFLFGAVHGALDVAMNEQAVVTERRQGRPIMSSLHALFSAGGLAGAATGGMMAAGGFRPLVHFALAATAFALLALAAGSHLPGTDFTERALAAEAKPGLARPSRALLTLAAIGLCSMIGEGAMADWSALFLRDVRLTGEGMAAAGYAAFSVAMMLARFGGDRVISRLGPVQTARLGGLTAAAGLLLALLVPSSMAALAGFAGVGLGFATLVPLVFSAAGRFPGMTPGAALATVTTLGYLGFLAGPPIIGFVAEGIGLPGALGLIVLTSLASVVLAPALEPRLAPADTPFSPTLKLSYATPRENLG